MNTTNIKTNIQAVPKELSFILFVLAVVYILWPARVDAATFSVATGSSVFNSDTVCQLDEALTNINDQARTYADCVETGAYGTDDTVNLPVGTIVGDGSGFGINRSAKIIGQGQGVSILTDRTVNLYGGSGAGDFLLQDFTIASDASLDGITTYQVENLTLERMELTTTDEDWIGLGISDSRQITVLDSYFHGTLDMSGSGLSQGILVETGTNGDTEITIERTTIDQLSRGITLQYAGSGAPVIDAMIKNTTITGMGTSNPYDESGPSYFSTGILAFTSGSNDDFGTINYTTINNTYSSIVPDNNASAILEANTGEGSINHTAQNDLYAIGNGSGSANYRKFIGSGADSSSLTTTSNGGNVSSDESFAGQLTQSTDKHIQTSLASFLGVLQDNGGSVPTLALLVGSPAINAGTSVLGLTTDARGSARLQSTATDAGAYESAFGAAAGAGNGIVPGTPNTGFGFFKNNPLAVLVASLISAVTIYIISRKQKFLKK